VSILNRRFTVPHRLVEVFKDYCRPLYFNVLPAHFPSQSVSIVLFLYGIPWTDFGTLVFFSAPSVPQSSSRLGFFQCHQIHYKPSFRTAPFGRYQYQNFPLTPPFSCAEVSLVGFLVYSRLPLFKHTRIFLRRLSLCPFPSPPCPLFSLVCEKISFWTVARS